MMPTRAATAVSESMPETFQSKYVGQLQQTMSAAFRSVAMALDTNVATDVGGLTTATKPAVYAVSEKINEIHRQIARLDSAKEVLNKIGASDQQKADVKSSVELLQSLAVSPVPVPVAGWSQANGPSLFFDQQGFYGDLEIANETIEYFLKWDDSNGSNEVYDVEPIESGRIPQKLLIHLYRAFARANG